MKKETGAIYLDYNATTPLDPSVAESMRPFLESNFGNPSSSHPIGRKAREFVEIARNQVAVMLGCLTKEIVFTSGGTESNNLALIGAALANRDKGNHIITSRIEHPAVLNVCEYLSSIGFEISQVQVDKTGMVDPAEIESELSKRTILISIMHANNEVGTIQPIQKISEIAHSHNIILHSDAAQSIGKIQVQCDELGVDLLSVAGHKIYAPKGIGTLYIGKGTRIQKILHGAEQENDLRPGTENVMAITGLGLACELISRNLEIYKKEMQQTRDLLHELLNKEFSDLVFNGHSDKCLPNTLNVSFPNIAANLILENLHGTAASAGAACHSNSVKISHVLTAMNIPEQIAMGTIRFSTGRITTSKQIMTSIPMIKQAVEFARKHTSN